MLQRVLYFNMFLQFTEVMHDILDLTEIIETVICHFYIIFNLAHMVHCNTMPCSLCKMF